MRLERLDHVNICTANIEATTDFFRPVIGIELGERPPFSFAGVWLYLNDQAVLHQVKSESPPAGSDAGIEHFAFRATDIEEFLSRLESASVAYRRATVPATGLEQIHFTDPNGNHFEVGFLPG